MNSLLLGLTSQTKEQLGALFGMDQGAVPTVFLAALNASFFANAAVLLKARGNFRRTEICIWIDFNRPNRQPSETGFEMLTKTITIDDLSVDDLESLECGAMQICRMQDRAGRYIMVVTAAQKKFKRVENYCRAQV